MKYRATPLEITVERMTEEGRAEQIPALIHTVVKDLLQNERGQLLVVILRTLEQGYMDRLKTATDAGEVHRLVGSMAALDAVREALTARLPDGEEFPEEEAEDELVEYDSPFQIQARADEEPTE